MDAVRGGRCGWGLTWVEVEAWEVDGGGLIVVRKEIRPSAHLCRVELLIVAEVAVEVHVLEGGGAEEALAAAGHQLVRSVVLDEVAHLCDPGLENFPRKVSGVPGLVGELPGQDGGVLSVRQVGVTDGGSREGSANGG